MHSLRCLAAVLCFSAPLALKAVADTSTAGSPGIALVVANSTYPDSDETLGVPISEAKAIADAARARGYVVEYAENVSKRALQAAIDHFASGIRTGAPVIIFFAGYGLQVGQQNYIIPTDAHIWNEPDVARDGIAVAGILKRADEKGAGQRVVLIDAARRNPFERRFRSYSAGLAPATASVKDIIVLSIGPGSVLSDDTPEGNAFGSEFAAAIRKEDVAALKAFEGARDALAKRSHNHAVPAIFAGTEAPPPSVEPKAIVASTADKPPKAETADKPAKTETTDKPAKAETADKPAKAETTDKPAKTEIAKIDAEPVKTTVPPQPEEKKTVSPSKADYDTWIAANPQDARALFEHGVLLAKNGDFASALAEFDRVVQLDPDNSKALNNRCFIRAILNELKKAATDCDYLLKTFAGTLDSKTFAETLDSRALVHLKVGEYALAIHDYSEALTVNAKFASALYGRGIAELRTGASAESEKDFKAARGIDPKIEQEYVSYGLR
jgi:tetratricopeptide (TPR) repeat protein